MSNWRFLKGSGFGEALGRNNGLGTTITAGGSAGVKGSYVSLGNTTDSYDGFILSIRGTASGAGDPVQTDVAFGATPDIVASNIYSETFWTSCAGMNIPVRIPSGVSLSVRMASSVAGVQSTVMAFGYKGDSLYRGYRSATQLQTFSGGIPVTGLALPGNTTQTAFTTLVSSTVEDYAGLIVDTPYDAKVSMTSAPISYEIAIGAAGLEKVIYSTIGFPLNYPFNNPPARTPIHVVASIPRGSRISFRLQAGSGTQTTTIYPIVMGLAL